MNRVFKPYHYLLYIPVGLISLYGLVSFGWLGFSAITDRAGLWGSMYLYYHMDKTLFSIYCFLVAAFSLVFLMAPAFLIMKGDRKRLIVIYRCFVAFIVLVVLLETGLSFRFEGKG